jgi:hypothetical protein
MGNAGDSELWGYEMLVIGNAGDRKCWGLGMLTRCGGPPDLLGVALLLPAAGECARDERGGRERRRRGSRRRTKGREGKWCGRNGKMKGKRGKVERKRRRGEGQAGLRPC